MRIVITRDEAGHVTVQTDFIDTAEYVALLEVAHAALDPASGVVATCLPE